MDLIDELLGVLGHGESSSREPGFVFFDLDETLVTRDTCLIDGFDSTRLVGTVVASLFALFDFEDSSFHSTMFF